MWEPGSGALINTVHGHLDTVKSLCFNPQTKNVALPLLASAGGYSIHLSDPRPSHKSNILALSPHEVKKEVESVTISPDGSLIASGGRDGMVVLMTLFVPSVIPQSASNLSHRQGFFKGRQSSKKYSQGATDRGDEGGLDAELEELDMILREPEPLQSQQNISRLKRISRTAVKTVELDEYSAAATKGVSARKSRGKRVRGKVIDIPTMVAHLSSTAKAIGPEELSSSDESDDTKHGHSKVPQPNKTQSGEGIVSRIRKLALPHHNEVTKSVRKASHAGEVDKLKKQFAAPPQLHTVQEQNHSEDDLEAQFLTGAPHSSDIQRSSPNDSFDVSIDHYNMFSPDQFNSSIVFSDSVSQGFSSPTHSESYSDNSLPTSPAKGILNRNTTPMSGMPLNI